MAGSSPSVAMRERSYPPPYPDGWYRVAGSHELSSGKVIYRECLGTQMVIYRSDADHRVHAMGAYCPHLGANLAGGCVKRGRLECPFHRWQFDADGSIAHIPYSSKLPKARQQTWPVRERYGQIFIYHAGGVRAQEDVLPPYELPTVPEIDDQRMMYRGRYDGGSVNMHLLEFAENSVDFQHFSPLHGEMFLPWTQIRIPGIEIQHQANWRIDDDHPHIARFENRSTLQILGRRVEKSRGDAVATFVGPASLIIFRISIPELGDVVFFQTHLPVRPLEQRVHFHWYATARLPRALVFYVVGNWVSQWRADVDVWENKMHLRKPLLVKGDGPVHRLRRWFSQFYPEPTTISPGAARKLRLAEST